MKTPAKKRPFPRKSERFEARLNAEQKYRIEYAASIKGRPSGLLLPEAPE